MIDSVKKTKAGKTRTDALFCDSQTDWNRPKRRSVTWKNLLMQSTAPASKPPTPILTKAPKDSEPAVLEKMQEVFSREVNK